MSLYYTPTSCGAASFISAFAAGVKLNADQVDFKTKKTDSGKDFNKINPKGNVPTIVLEDGTVLAENVATLLYIADQAPGKVAPATGTSGYYATIHALAWAASELHQSLGPLIHQSLGPLIHASQPEDVYKANATKNATKFKYLNDVVLAGGKKFVVGDKFTVADAYTGILLNTAVYQVKLDLAAYPNVQSYLDHFNELSIVKDARARMETKPATTI